MTLSATKKRNRNQNRIVRARRRFAPANGSLDLGASAASLVVGVSESVRSCVFPMEPSQSIAMKKRSNLYLKSVTLKPALRMRFYL